jgi:hypothetical protein
MSDPMRVAWECLAYYPDVLQVQQQRPASITAGERRCIHGARRDNA